MIRRRMIHLALAMVPALAVSGLAAAQHGAPGGSLDMEQLHQMLQDIPGDEYKTANQLKNEALHGLMMGTDSAAATEIKLKAFAAEYSRVAGTDPKGMEAHVLEVGGQLAVMLKDPQFQAHLAQLHASH